MHPYRLTNMAAVKYKERVTIPGCQEVICYFHSFPSCSIVTVMGLKFFCITILARKSNCRILRESIYANMDNILNFLYSQLIHALLEYKS